MSDIDVGIFRYFVGLLISTPLVYSLVKGTAKRFYIEENYMLAVVLILIVAIIWPFALLIAGIVGLLKLCDNIWGK